MSPARVAAWTAVAIAVALVPLLLIDGPQRAIGFRVACGLVAVATVRAIVRFSEASATAPRDSAFRRPRRLPRIARAGVAPFDQLEGLLLGAQERAGQFHLRLRPVLQEIASERLLATHGIDLSDPSAADAIGDAVAWEHLRPNRPAPTDRRGPGPTREELERTITVLEQMR